MKKGIKFHIVAAVLATVMLVYSMPVEVLQVLADGIGEILTPVNTIEQKYYPGEMVDEYNIGNSYIVQENEENRTLTTKEFLMSDDTIMVQQFIEPVHYYEGGEYKEIDNTLTEKVENGKKIYENSANSLKVKFYEAGDSGQEIVEIAEDGYSLQFGYKEKNFKNAKCEIKNVNKGKIEYINKKRPQIEKTPVGQITYDFEDEPVNIIYKIKNNKLNENIFIEEKHDDYSYAFEIESAGLRFEQNEDGSITVYNASGKDKFFMSAPYMTDANGVQSNAVEYTFAETKGKTELTITADAAWINDKAVLPVTITSEIVSVKDKHFSYANVYEIGETVVNAEQVYAGKKNGAEKSGVFFNFELPEAEPYYQLIGAAVNFEYETNGKGLFDDKDLNYNIYVAESTRDISEITYSKKPKKMQSLESIQRVSLRARRQSVYESNIINVNNIDKNTLTIGIEPPEEMSENSYIAIETSASETTGALYWYERVTGIEDDYSMEEFAISGVSARINNGTGQLNATVDLVSVNTLSDIPFEASLVYNDYYNDVLAGIGKESIAGNNIKLNFQQYMILRGSVYEMIDADGSISTFYAIDPGLYYSKEKKLYYNPTTNIAYDVLGNQMLFANGRLTKISSQNNPSEYIEVIYTTDSSDLINQVVYYANSAAKYTMNFAYSDNKIASVTTNADADNPCKIALEYDAGGNLVGIQNKTGNAGSVQTVTLGYIGRAYPDDPDGMLNYAYDNLKCGMVFYRDYDDTVYEVRNIDGESVNGEWRSRSMVSFGYYGGYTEIYYYENNILTDIRSVSFNNTRKVISEWRQDSRGIVSVQATTNWKNEDNLTENYTEEICGHYHSTVNMQNNGINPGGRLVKTINSAMSGVEHNENNRYTVVFQVFMSNDETEIAKGLNLSVKIGNNPAENIILNQGGNTYICIPCGYFEEDTTVTINNNGTGYIAIQFFDYTAVDSVQKTNTYDSAIKAHTLTSAETNLRSGNYVRTTYDSKQRITQTQTVLLGTDEVQETQTYSYYDDGATYFQKGKIKESVTVDETGAQVEKTEYAYTGNRNNYTEKAITTQGTEKMQTVYNIDRSNSPFVVTQTDENNIETKAYYKPMNGDIRLWKVKSNNAREEYAYNNLGLTTGIKVYDDTTGALVYSQTDNYDANGIYTGSAYGGTAYTYGYDDTGFITGIGREQAGGDSESLINYVYNSHGYMAGSNRLSKKTYANGNVENYMYFADYTGQTTQVQHKNTATGAVEGTYTYEYNENGAMTGQNYQYGASRLSYNYGQLNNRDRQTLTIGGLEYYFEYTVNYDRAHNRAASASINMGRGCATYQRNMSYEYDAKGQVTGFTYHTYDAVYGYDEMGRLTNKTAEGYGETIQNEEYIYNTYTKDGVLYTTNRLARIEDKTSKSEDRTTTYDENGYITGISYNGNSYEYTYDAVGRITQEKKNGTVQGSYTYDGANNIQKSGLAYTDGELTSVNGAPIEYDEMGNPTTYKGQAFRWEQGRKLAAGTLNGNNFAYEYDGNGMRFKKTVNGKSTEYYYNGTELLAENRNGERIYYIYGVTGIEGIEIADTCYYFDKNTLGDIVAIRNRSGAVVAKYEYDAWGNVTVTDAEGKEETSAEFIGNKNPIRYRGYYYDAETGFYYLQTRYYDPEICRFINADDYELIATLAEIPGQLNLYAYCNNNPVMLTDETGTILLSLLISALIGAGVSAVSSIVFQLSTTHEVDWGQVGISVRLVR